jgi:hypothetical protein
MNIGRCVNDAIEVYKKNWLVLVLASIILNVLMLVTLLILAGPLCGGFSKMTLNALRREDRTVNLGDLFGCFDRFFGLLGMFFFTFIAILLGFVLCIVPGFALMTIWLFCFFLLVDRDMGVFESLGVSQNIVSRKGLGVNLLVVLIVFGISILPEAIPYVGIVIGWFLMPIAWLIEASAYVQQVDEDDGSLADLFSETDLSPEAVPEVGAEDQWRPVS